MARESGGGGGDSGPGLIKKQYKVIDKSGKEITIEVFVQDLSWYQNAAGQIVQDNSEYVVFGLGKLIKSVFTKIFSSFAVKGGVQFGENVLSTTTRTSTKYGNSVEVLFKNGNKIDINATRVKEWVPNLHPNAPTRTFQKVKFDNFLPNSKGFKRTPTQEELDFLNSLFK